MALAALGTATNHAPASSPVATHALTSRADGIRALAKLPTAFQQESSGFLARGSGYDVFLDRRGVTLALQHGNSRRPAILRSTLVGARRVSPTSESRLPGVVNQYGGPRSSWREGIPTFAKVRYPSVYPGIDAVYHGRNGRLEYDFEVAPGADPRAIAIRLSGARSLRIAGNGDLAIRLTHGTIRQTQPVAYQEIAGRRVPVDAAYRMKGGRIGFVVGAYDRSRPLVIDPVLSYATYYGGGGMDTVTSVGIGSDGSMYLAGGTHSSTLPGGTETRSFSNEDAFVTRIAADGASVIYSTMLGGDKSNAGWTDSFSDDQANDMIVSGTTAIIVGGAKSGPADSSYPTNVTYPEDALGSCSSGGENAFLTFIASGGTLGYSSCFGGASDDAALGLATRYVGGINKRTNYAIVGRTKSSDLPGGSAVAGFQNSTGGAQDGFLVQVASDAFGTCAETASPCVFIHYRTYIGGSSDDAANAVQYDSSGNSVVAGQTNSTNFPLSSGSDLPGADGWVASFGVTGSPGTNVRNYSVLYGGDGDDSANDLALDSSNNSYIVGSTSSTNLPAAASSGNLVRGGGEDGFIAQLNSSGSAANSVYVGGTGDDSLNSLALQQNGGNVAEYAVGTTNSGPSDTFVPRNTVPGHSCSDGNTQALVVKRIVGASPEGAVIACLGGSDADGDFGNAVAVPSTVTDGTIFVGGNTGGAFAGVNGVRTTHGGGNLDGFLAKLTQTPPSIESGPAEGAIVGAAPVEFGLSGSEAGMHFGCSAPVANQLVAGTRGTANCAGSSASYTGLVDGAHTFEATTLDAFGSESAAATRTFTVDTTPPDAFDLTAPADGDTLHTTQPTFSWAESHDLHNVSYAVVVDGQTINTVAAPACSAGSCSAQAVGPIGDGAHTVKVVASDGASPANTRESSTRGFSVVDPVQARFIMSPNPALVGRTVQFDGSASADASHKIVHYEWDLDGDGTFETDTGTTPTTTRTFVGAGTFNIGLRVTGDVGGTGTATQSLKVNDPTNGVAQIGVSINEGAQYTNTPNVKLKIVAPAGATGLLVSNDGGFAGALPTAVTKEMAWKLDSSGPERLPKTVYLRFLTGPFASPNYTDDIILDERPPVVDSAAVAGAPAAARAATSAKTKTWKVKVKAHDTNSGVGFVQVTTNKKKPGKLIAYKKTVKAKLPARPRFLRARDRAGNYSPWKKLR